MIPLYLKHVLIRTPLERPLVRLRHMMKAWQVLRHPELQDVYNEEREIEKLFDLIIRPNSNCVDIGAHLGSTLSSIVRRAPQGQHIAFEPVPRKAAWLRTKFPEVDIRELALADKSEVRCFAVNKKCSALSGLLPDSQSPSEENTIACDCLDNIIKPNRSVDFLKIDVEGAELLVLRGADSILRRDHPAILFESTPGGADKFGMNRDQLFQFLTNEFGYSIYIIRDYLRGKRPLDQNSFAASHDYPFRAFNYLAIHR